MAKPLSTLLFLAGTEIAAADPPVDETPPSLAEVRGAVSKLKGEKAANVSKVSA